MSTVLENLKNQVLSLPHEDRSRLLDSIVESLDDEQSLDEVWDQEAAQRDLEIESGASASVDGKEVLARLRAQIR